MNRGPLVLAAGRYGGRPNEITLIDPEKMKIFKETPDTKRVIFNVRLDLAERLERAKEDARVFGRKLDVDGAVDKALEKFLKKAEKKMQELSRELKISSDHSRHPSATDGLSAGVDDNRTDADEA